MVQSRTLEQGQIFGYGKELYKLMEGELWI